MLDDTVHVADVASDSCIRTICSRIIKTLHLDRFGKLFTGTSLIFSVSYANKVYSFSGVVLVTVKI